LLNVHDLELFAKPLLHLHLPLFREVCGAHDEHALDCLSRLKPCEDHACLDHLPEVYLISDKHPLFRGVQKFQKGFELVRIESCSGGINHSPNQARIGNTLHFIANLVLRAASSMPFLLRLFARRNLRPNKLVMKHKI